MATKNVNTAGDSSTVKKSSNTTAKAKTASTTKSKTETKSATKTEAASKTKSTVKPKVTEESKDQQKKPAAKEQQKKSTAKTETVSKSEAKTKTEAKAKTETKSKSTETKSKNETKSKSTETKPVESKSKQETKSKSTETKPKSTETKSKTKTKSKSEEKKAPAQAKTPRKDAAEEQVVKETEETVTKDAKENQAEIKITLDAQTIAEAGKKLAELEEYVPEPVKKKLSKAKKIVIAAVSFMVVMLTAAWAFGGKPIVEIGAEGFSVYPTEDPIIYHIPEYLSGEYPPETHYSDINGTGGVFTTSIVISPDKVTISGSMAGLDNSGNLQKKASGGENDAGQEKSTGAEKTLSSEKASEKIAKVKNGTRGSSAEADRGYAENNPLYLGNPTDSLAKTEMNTNYLMVKDQYTLSYNTTTLCPNWAAWHLDKANMGAADRSDDFRPDEELPIEWYGVKKADYQYNKYGFDRGHICPSADRTATKLDNSMTFLMTNMVPQSPDNNRVIWMHFENYERELVKTGNEVYIIAGPYGTGGTSQKGSFDNIPISLKSKEVLYMNVPAYTWKVLIAIPEGEDDISRIGKDAIVIAINVPNEMGMGKTGDWDQFICTVDDIEEITGYDFFELLPDDVEDVLESQKYVYTK